MERDIAVKVYFCFFSIFNSEKPDGYRLIKKKGNEKNVK